MLVRSDVEDPACSQTKETGIDNACMVSHGEKRSRVIVGVPISRKNILAITVRAFHTYAQAEIDGQKFAELLLAEFPQLRDDVHE